MNWMPYARELPMERQGIAPFCVSFAACNAYEVLQKSRGAEVNLSDRYLAVTSGTTLEGNNFPAVLDTFRDHGVVAESECPFPWLYRIFYKLFWGRIFNLSRVDPAATRHRISRWSQIETTYQGLEDALETSPLLLLVQGYKATSRHGVVALKLDGDEITVFDSVLTKFRTLWVGVESIFNAYTIGVEP